MGETVTRLATYDDLKAVPVELVAEIIGGRLVTHPRPRPRHAAAASGLGAKLGGSYHHGDNGPGGWRILDEPEVHLGADVVVPDLAGWRRERMPRLPDTAWFELAPDWVCEVVSPSTARCDRLEKRNTYGRSGVVHLWFVDPDARTLEAFELRAGEWVLIAAHGSDETVAVPPFDAVPLPLGALWAE